MRRDIPPDEEFGPLPKVDHNALLQQRSITAVRSSMQQAKLWFRDERADDFGVDGSLEVLLENGGATNTRAQVQLKAVTVAQSNSDGSISYPIEVKNLNYLLNGPSPIYLLYDDKSQQIYFRWAYDILQGLEQSKSSWQGQQTVAVRFKDALTTASLAKIRSRIINEGKQHREFRETLARAQSERLFSPPLPQAVSAGEAKRLLESQGLALVGAGLLEVAQRLLNLVSEADKSGSKILLVQAYLAHSRGRLFESLGYAKRAKTDARGLVAEQRTLLLQVQLYAQLQLGILNETTYVLELEKALQEDPGICSSALKIELLKRKALAAQTVEERQKYAAPLTAMLESVAADPAESERSRLDAELLLGHFVATGLGMDVVKEQFAIYARKSVGKWTAELADTGLDEAQAAEDAYRIKFEQLLDRALLVQNPVLIGDAKRLLAAIQFAQLVRNWQAAHYRNDSWVAPFDKISALQQLCTEAIDAYKSVDAAEGTLYARALFAELAELAGEEVQSRKTWQEIAADAEALGFDDFVQRAEQALNGNSTLRQMQARAEIVVNTDRDEIEADLNDQQLLDHANFLLHVLKLPESRKAVLVDEVRSFRAVAQEHLYWCRHLELHQDRRHGDQQETMYLVAPNRKAICTLLGFPSSIESPEWEGVLPAFKGRFCASCVHQDPKKQSSHG